MFFDCGNEKKVPYNIDSMTRRILLPFLLTLLSSGAHAQQPDTLIRKPDSLSQKSDSAKPNSTVSSAYNVTTAPNVPTYIDPLKNFSFPSGHAGSALSFTACAYTSCGVKKKTKEEIKSTPQTRRAQSR